LGFQKDTTIFKIYSLWITCVQEHYLQEYLNNLANIVIFYRTQALFT